MNKFGKRYDSTSAYRVQVAKRETSKVKIIFFNDTQVFWAEIKATTVWNFR